MAQPPSGVEFTLDEDLFRGLGAAWPEPHSPISPWEDADLTVTKEVRHKLRSLGVLDGDRLAAAWRPTLSAIADATGMTRVSFAGAGTRVEYTVFVSQDFGPVALFTTTKDGHFRVSDPAPTERAIEYLTGLVGRSRFRGLELDLTLPINEAFVLAALADRQRRLAFADLAQGRVASTPHTGIDTLSRALREAPRGGFWLVDTIARTCGSDPSHAAADVHDSLARLAHRNVVAATPTTAELAGECAALAEHFLAISSVVELHNASLEAERPESVKTLGFTCVQAGITDLMTVEWVVRRGIHLETVSADTVTGYLSTFLRHPDFTASSDMAGARPLIVDRIS